MNDRLVLGGSIVIGAAIIAAAILLVFRWEVAAGMGTAYRIDRWSGAVQHCQHNLAAPLGHEMKCDPD